MTTFGVTIFPKVNGKRRDFLELTFEQLAQRIQSATEFSSKKDCPLVKLARFGNAVSEKGSLRHDENVVEIFGVEGDYDDGQVAFQEARETLQAAGVRAVLCTTASHTAEKPRWRVFAPLSKPCAPKERRRLTARLNGLLGGILARESFTLSQCFYVGRVAGVTFECAGIEGEPLDTIEEVTEIYPDGNGEDHTATTDTTTDAELRAAFSRGEGRQTAMLKLSSRWAAQGLVADDIEAALLGLLNASGVDPHNAEGVDLRSKAHGIADTAVQKFGESRREKFREESRRIGEGLSEPKHRPAIYTLQEMIEEAIFISSGQQVAPRSDPRLVWSFPDFRAATAASRHRRGSCANAWRNSPLRTTVYTRTFKAGAPLICQSPGDEKAINTWRVPPRMPAPPDWAQRAALFLRHLEYLVPVISEREDLLDWLAHIEQCPEALPHFHFLMTAKKQGVGRNWLAGVLARIWAGVTALGVDLPKLMEGGFNGQLSRKVFAVVDEIHEGSRAVRHRHADALKRLLTEEVRRVNPKYGREYDEFNAVRWLLLSNHEDAVPLDRFDRRIYAIANPEEPRASDYYTRLYAAAHDADFIASVRELLRTRDIARFNPGMHAPMSEAKANLIRAQLTEADAEMKDLVETYPGACITSKALGDRLFGETSEDRRALAAVARAGGATAYKSKLEIDGKKQRVWILKDHQLWRAKTLREIRAEVVRGRQASPTAADGEVEDGF